jgi:hypothetical protein
VTQGGLAAHSHIDISLWLAFAAASGTSGQLAALAGPLALAALDAFAALGALAPPLAFGVEAGGGVVEGCAGCVFAGGGCGCGSTTSSMRTVLACASYGRAPPSARADDGRGKRAVCHA